MKHSVFIFLALFLVFNVRAQQSKLETVIQKGHSAAVKAVAASPNGIYLATGSRDKTVKIWDRQTGLEIRTLVGHEHTINALNFSPNGELLATSSADGTARVWEISSGKQLFSSPVHDKYITAVAFHPNGKFFAYGGYIDSINIYSIPEGKLIKRLPAEPDQGSGYGITLSFSADGNWLAVGEDNKTASIYNTTTWNNAYTLKPTEGWCGGCGTMVRFSTDNKFLFKLAHNDKLRQYNVSTGELIETYGDAVDNLRALIVSKDGQHVVSVADSILINWVINSKETTSFKLPFYETINDVVYSTDESELLAGSGNMTAFAMMPNTGEVIRIYKGTLQEQDKGGIDYNADDYWQSYIARYMRLKNKLLLTKDDKSFITGKTGVHGIQWDISTGSPNKLYDGHSKAVICMSQSADGSILATADAAGEVLLWNTKTGVLIHKIKAHSEPIFDVSVSNDGKSVATASWDTGINVYDVATGDLTSEMYLRENACYSLSFTPNGLYVLSGRLDKSLELREPDSKKVVLTFIGHTDVISSISFGVNPNHALTASWDGTARIWDVTTGLMIQKFKGSKGMLHAAIYNADGKKVITGGDDRIIRIWDVQNGNVIKTLLGHQAEITSLALSKDGKMLVSYSTDGVVKCWNLETGLEFYEHVHISSRDWMARTPQGYFSATEQARSDIHFVKGMQVYAVDQFFQYYRPDLIKRIFVTRGISPTGMEKEKGVNEKLQSLPPPTIKIACMPSEDGLNTTVHIKVIDEGGGLEELRLSHNGKSIPSNFDPSKLPKGKGNSFVYSLKTPLVRGSNQFSAVGVSTSKIESTASVASIYSETALSAAVCHVFVIGIDAYKNSTYKLNYAQEDAEAFASAMQTNGSKLYKQVKIHALYDEHATRERVLDTLKSLENQISIHDVFIFYYAGHGAMVDQNFFFIPTECTSMYQANSSNAISAESMQAGFKNIKALKQIIIMDACQSGGSVEVLAMRGANEEKAFAQLSRGAGIHVMASAGSEQNAKEIAELKHGLFTYVLLKAINGAADGSPKDGKVTIYELKSYLDDQVPELNALYSGKLQFPYTFSRGSDFPIVLE
jgi:WD40 repeat protein